MLMFRGKVISPNLHVIKVIYNYFDYLSSITPISGTTVYFANTLLSYDWATIANLALMSEWFLSTIVRV